MSEIVLKDAVKREQGYLYFVDATGNVCRAKMTHHGRTKKKDKGDK